MARVYKPHKDIVAVTAHLLLLLAVIIGSAEGQNEGHEGDAGDDEVHPSALATAWQMSWDDVSIFVTNKAQNSVDGIEDADGEALESLLSFSGLNRATVEELESNSTQVLITNVTHVQSNACSIPVSQASVFQADENGGRRLLQCLFFFSSCATTATSICTIVDGVDICGPDPSPEEVYLTLCVQDECVTFDIPSGDLGGGIYSDAKQICPDIFPDTHKAMDGE